MKKLKVKINSFFQRMGRMYYGQNGRHMELLM